MSCLTTAWTWLRIQIRELRPQLRLCLRVTVAALVSFVLGKSLHIPFGGVWVVLTAVVVTQMSVGGSLKATIEYFTGTLGGAVYAGVIAVLIPPTNEFALSIALAIAVAPLALLAAINASFRVGPMTAVFVVVGSSLTHAGPVESAVYRVLEVAIGGVIGLAVSLLVFPARAHILAIESAASMLDLMAGVLPELLIGFTQTLDETAILQRQDRIDQAFTQLATIAVEATRERMAHLASEPDTALMLRMLLRLRHDIVMIGRAAVVPLSETLQARLGPPLARAAETAVDYLRGSSAALIARRNPPPLAAVDVAFDGYAAEITALRREGLTRDLPVDALERLFALGFALEQLRHDFRELEQCVTEDARSTMGTGLKRAN
jgi:uncharacterized membrane protein YccC